MAQILELKPREESIETEMIDDVSTTPSVCDCGSVTNIIIGVEVYCEYCDDFKGVI